MLSLAARAPVCRPARLLGSQACLRRPPTSHPVVGRNLARPSSSLAPVPTHPDNTRPADEDDDVMDLSALSRHLEEGYDILTPDDASTSSGLPARLREVPPSIELPPYARDPDNGAHYPRFWREEFKIELGGEMEMRARRAGALARETLARAGELVEPGRTTDEIDTILHSFITSHDAYPSPLNYRRFPRSICTSVNNVIVHGIPSSSRALLSGDIVNVDITVYLDGFHGDTSRTFLCGEVDERGKELVRVTEEALEAGLTLCEPGRPFREIGRAIGDYVRRYGPGMSVSPQFTGHGIGRWFHHPPWILHHRNEEPGVMEPGHCFTIEPCVVDDEDWRGFLWPDGWTVSTVTGARSAQAEQTVLITQNGVEVLTR